MQQVLCIYGRFVEEFLQGAWRNAYLLGQPSVGVALAAELVADKVAYVYLHNVRGFCSATINHFTDTKKGANLSTRVRGKRRRNPQLYNNRLVYTLKGKYNCRAFINVSVGFAANNIRFVKKTVSYAFSSNANNS